jgi:Arc/MetJ-type ribon-helix-helix transcriptional regulator
MQVEKISVSLSPYLVEFLENYKLSHNLKSRSQVVEQAILLLRSQDLESAYRLANQEIDPDWENTVADGLNEDETW